MDDPVAELTQQAAHLDHEVSAVFLLHLAVFDRRGSRVGHMFSSRKIRANTASSRMMAKIA